MVILVERQEQLASEWHPTKNGFSVFKDFPLNSHKKVWWLCGKGHEWEARLDHRNTSSSDCPYCAGRLAIVGENDLATTHPFIAAEWHPTKNGELKPCQFMKGSSSKKIWWLGECGHEWETVIRNRTAGKNCPHCGGKLLTGFNDLNTLNPILAAQWHPTKNNLSKPENFTIGSSHIKIWWVCEFGHEWETSIRNREKFGNNCPFCSGRKCILGLTDLVTTHPELVEEWHPTKNGALKPEYFSYGSSVAQIWWLGACKHEWQTTISNRAGPKKYGCPKCGNQISKAEQEIFDYLTTLGLVVEQSNRKVLGGRELDIYIPEKKFAIEYNGLYWHSEDAGRGKSYHYDKWFECRQQGIQLVQIWEDDWNRDKQLVLNSLSHKLGLSVQEKLFARKTKVFSMSTQDAKTFFGVNHIQGFASGSYYVGLRDANGVVRSAIILKREQGSVLNIVRYATSANVVGGFSKLLKFAVKTYVPDSFITFSDHCVSDGGLYENNGFVVDGELKPDYMYIVDGVRKHKFGYRLAKFKSDPDLLWEEGLTERELALLNDLPRVWDAGKTRWRFNVVKVELPV